MFISKSKLKSITEAYQRRIDELENRLCPLNNHDYVVTKKYFNSSYSLGIVDTWEVRHLECARCGRKIKDGSELGFKYQARENGSLT